MATNAVVGSRISTEPTQKATAVLDKMGLTASDVMHIVLTLIASRAGQVGFRDREERFLSERDGPFRRTSSATGLSR
jgi:hypothetical protein